MTACKMVGIGDFRFHDLRHYAINNLRKEGRKEGNDFFKIMKLSGHRAVSVFKRYNGVDEQELSEIKWPSQVKIAGTMDTNMDTNKKEASHGSP